MAEPYNFSGRSGLFFDRLYGSQLPGSKLERAMAQLCPCLFFFDGECKIHADKYGSEEEAKDPGEEKKTPCVGAKVRCDYYTGKFEYLVKDYVKDGKLVLAQHVIELFQVYLKHQCPYEVVNTFVTEKGVSSYWREYIDDFDNKIVLPRRVFIKDEEVTSLPYHPTSLEYSDYLDFVTDEYFKFLFPRAIYPLNTTDIVCQNEEISVLLDIPRNGYTYIIYLSELDLSEDILDIIDGFFKTGVSVKRDVDGNVIKDDNSVLSLEYFFKNVFKKLRSKQDSNLIMECTNVGFGVTLAKLLLKYDLSKSLIIYSESNLIFGEEVFDLNKILIGMINIDNAYGMKFDMSYCDINFASNCIYDLSTDYTLDVSYNDSTIPTKPTIKGDYKGQDLSFGSRFSIINNKKDIQISDEDIQTSNEDKKISITALPLPWYNSDETTKKYLWSLKKKEEKYTIEIDCNETEKEFDLGKITIFKNVIILCIKDTAFPFYIKDCTFNSYKYIVKYQTYHPMLEYYDVDPDFSFSLDTPASLFVEKEVTQQPNPDRYSEAQPETKSSVPEVILLKSLAPGVVILVPDIEGYLEDFKDTIKLKFTLVKGDKVEYISDVSTCKDEDEALFIPNKCDSLEQFKFKDLIKEENCEDTVKVTFEEKEDDDGDEDETDETVISMSSLVKGDMKQEYYVEITCALEVDPGIGAIYKQEDLKSVSYFYFSYLSFKFLFDSVSGKTDIVSEGYDEINKINTRIETEKIEESEESEEEFDPENSPVQKLLRGERPLISVDDLDVAQEAVNGEGAEGQEAYDFKYLYEHTVRSYVNNKFYEPFTINFLCRDKDSSAGKWASLFTESVSDFYILKQIEDAKKPKDTLIPDPPVKVKHDLTHILDVYKCFGMPFCGFNKDKLKLDNKYKNGTEDSIFDKMVIDNFLCELDKVFYFYVLGVSKFVQDYIFFIKYKDNIIPVLKRIPVIVSQVGLPDPEVQYKWKSECSIYTHACDTDLNPFTKVVDSDNLDFFVNPFYVIVHKDYRDNKYEDDRTATEDYSFLFTSKWWVKYKKDVDTYGRIKQRYSKNIFLNVYRTLAKLGDTEPKEEDIIRGFAKGKSILYIELESISYVYSSYCGDHDFSLGNTTPYLYDRASDYPLVTDAEVSPYYTGSYDKNGIGMRRSRPCSRFVGPMWFPFRSCEVARYAEFADYPGVKHITDSYQRIHSRSLRGFSCTDLIFKPYNSESIEFSDFKYLFIDDCFGFINPYRYSSSFYSVDTMYYCDPSVPGGRIEVSPTYLPSNASIPWRSVPIFFKEDDYVKYIVIIEPRTGAVIRSTIASGIVDNYVVLDVENYKEFKVDETNISVTKSEMPEFGVTRSILYNCLKDTPPILPYNYSKDKYISGYERMRGGDANFIYQSLYPYHHNYPYHSSCGCIYDYKHRGEDAYGPIENTLLPGVISETSEGGIVMGETIEIKTLIHNSIFTPGICCNGSAHGMYHLNMQRPLFAYDWLNQDAPFADLGCAGQSERFSPIATKDILPWVRDDYEFWSNYDLLNGCETDGPYPMKICLNKYYDIDNDKYFIDSIFIDEDANCCDPNFITDSSKYSVTNLTSEPLYYHFASSWEEAYDYVFLGASMDTKPVFYGDGSLRMFETYDKFKTSYFVFDEDSGAKNVSAMPVFGGLGKFFRMCYFSTYYGKVPFSTLSGVNTVQDDDPNRDDNYVYKLSGYNNNDVAFDNDFKYGYLPEKKLVFITDDFSLFKSVASFTEDDSITLEVRDAVRFRDLVQYEENGNVGDGTTTSGVGYYKYKGGNEIEIVTFGGKDPIESGPAFVLVYDTSVSSLDKYTYYSGYGCCISIADPIVDDMGVVVDPFPFGEEVEISYLPLTYNGGYLENTFITLQIVGWGCCPVVVPCYIDIKVKEREQGTGGLPWMFYVESEENVVNEDGKVETKTVEIQKVYLCYGDDYAVGKLVKKDDDDDMSLSDYDIIKKGNFKYKINRGFYVDLSNMLLPYTKITETLNVKGLNTSNFFAEMDSASIEDFCMCVDKGYSESKESSYIRIPNNCFIISLEGSVFLSDKYEYEKTVGYLALETSEELYVIGNLKVTPEFNSSGENVENNGKYHYTLRLDLYSNYNKIKYCGTKYRLVFDRVVFLCESHEDEKVKVEYGIFNGGTLCNITFNNVSSLKAITYSKSISDVLSCNTEGIDLYNENLNDKITINNALFYAMPFGFVHKLAGGISEDKASKFKNGYNNLFSAPAGFINYSDDEQEFLDKIMLPVEKDVFGLIHYPTCFVRFCLKSKLRDISSEIDVNFDMSLVPNLCNSFGYVPIQQWVAPGHKLDLYPDSFYGKERTIFSSYEETSFDPGSFAPSLGLMAPAFFSTPSWSKKVFAFDKYFMDPYNLLFITHVNHGMFGYPGIVDVSDWIKEPAKPTVYEIYDKDGNLINEE